MAGKDTAAHYLEHVSLSVPHIHSPYDIRFMTAPWGCNPGKLLDSYCAAANINRCPLCSLTYGESSDKLTRPSETMTAWRRLPRSKSRKPQNGVT